MKDEKQDFEGNALHVHASRYYHEQSYYSENGYEIVAFLLSRGISINSRNTKGETPLHMAAKGKCTHASLRCIENLLEKGADINAATQEGLTAFHFFAKASADPKYVEDTIKFFLSKGGDINVVDKQGRTPLMLAAESGRAYIYDALVKNGARVLCKDTLEKISASGFARKGGHYHLADHIMQVENLEMKRAELPAEDSQKEAEKIPETVPIVSAAAPPGASWNPLAPGKIARITIEKELGYKITEVFNFEAGIYTCISQNLRTQAESLSVKAFSELSEAPLLGQALKELEQSSRQLPENAAIDKPKPKGLHKPII